jgi:hypothetical protein
MTFDYQSIYLTNQSNYLANHSTYLTKMYCVN